MPDLEPVLPVEPLSALGYLAADFQKRYGVPCRVTAVVDTGGWQDIKVFAWRSGRWIEQEDAFTKEGETRPHVPGRSTAP